MRFRIGLWVVAATPVAYLLFWPVPVEPKPWFATAFSGYVGVHAPNSRLSGLTAISLARKFHECLRNAAWVLR